MQLTPQLTPGLAWILLFIAGLCEVAWAVGLKYTDNFTRLWPSVGTVVAMVASVVLLGYTLKTLPLGTAYAVWTGIGIIGAALLGILLFDEPRDLLRIGCICLIVLGIMGLKLSSKQ